MLLVYFLLFLKMLLLIEMLVKLDNRESSINLALDKLNGRMKIETLVFTAFLFIIAIGGWHQYREHFIFQGQDEEIVRKTLADKAHFIMQQ